MKNFILKKASALLFVSCMVINVHAQSNNPVDHAVQKTNEKINSMIDNVFSKKAKHTDPTPTGSKIRINSSFDFVACDSAVFDDNFSSAEIGKMPSGWKTNGSGQVIQSPDLTGKWFQLQNYSSYKTTKLIKYPSKFTIEFDIIAVADKIDDLYPLSFGFARDNSVRSGISDAYNNGAINNISLSYYNRHGTIESSSDTKYNHTNDLDLQGFANQVMHVSISVDGEFEQVYLDKTKISDTKMFNPDRTKYFYISSPMTYKNGAKVLFGNFRMMACN